MNNFYNYILLVITIGTKKFKSKFYKLWIVIVSFEIQYTTNWPNLKHMNFLFYKKKKVIKIFLYESRFDVWIFNRLLIIGFLMRTC